VCETKQYECNNSFVFASYSFTLSYSLSSQDLSSVLNAGGSLIQTLL